MSGTRRSCTSTLKKKFGPTAEEFLSAQKGICPLCGNRILSLRKANFDHVIAHSNGGKIMGNVLLTHAKCNTQKQAFAAHPIYEEILGIVNKKLGWNGRRYTNCKAFAEIERHKTIVNAHTKKGIKIIVLRADCWQLTNWGYDEHHDIILAHFQTFLIKPTIDVQEKRMRIFHHGLK